MSTFYLTQRPDLGVLSAGMWPDRKRPMLCISRGTTAEVIAYFRDDATQRAFEHWLIAVLCDLRPDLVESHSAERAAGWV
jgi:hypothetical protein